MATQTRPTVTKCIVCGGIYDSYRIERHTSSNSAPFKCPGSDAPAPTHAFEPPYTAHYGGPRFDRCAVCGIRRVEHDAQPA